MMGNSQLPVCSVRNIKDLLKMSLIGLCYDPTVFLTFLRRCRIGLLIEIAALFIGRDIARGVRRNLEKKLAECSSEAASQNKTRTATCLCNFHRPARLSGEWAAWLTMKKKKK